jgi:small GTP-binding protein
MIPLKHIDSYSNATYVYSKSNEIIKTIYNLKVLLIGNSGVGKTSLLNRYINNSFNPHQFCTLTAENKIKSINIDSSTSAQVTLWDTAGQEKYRSLTRQFFLNTNGVILMYDVCSENSFEGLKMWLDDIKNNTSNEDVSIILVGNKIDLEERCINYEDANKFAQDNDMLYCETSSKEGINVESPFERITKEIVEKIRRKQKFEKEVNENLSVNTTNAIKGKDFSYENRFKCC